MNRSLLVATCMLPLFCAAPGLSQAKKPRSAPDPIASIRSVQKALNATELAEIELLAAARRGGKVDKELQLLGEAITRLRMARSLLHQQSIQRPGKEVRPPKKVAAQLQEEAAEPALDGRSPFRVFVNRGLEWLKRHQDKDGKWDADGFMKHDTRGPMSDGAGNPVHDVGVTALALLAFLEDGSTMRSGPYLDAVKKAVVFLRNQQHPNGLFGESVSHDYIYDHAIAAYAMCEAYGRSNYRLLKKCAQKGIDYLESHRNPYAVWRYQPRDNDNDSSVTGWCIQAYCSAKRHGLNVNEQALKIAAAFLKELTESETGMTGYTKRGEPSSRHPGDHGTRFPPAKNGATLTATALASRFALGQTPKRTRVMHNSAGLLLDALPQNSKPGQVDHYYWYYGTKALAQMGARTWERWKIALTPVAFATQRQNGNFKGSWDPTGVWGEDGGRVYSTAMMVLSLSTMARH